MLKYLAKFLLSITVLLFSYTVYGQCRIERTLSICDMASIDFDTDGTPDGIINLYDEYNSAFGGTLETGTWSVNPRYDIILDKITGNVSLWDAQFATNIDNLGEYEFELFTPSCGADPAVILTLNLGPYSGVALPAFGINNINVETCDSRPFDLYTALVSNNQIPQVHLNGKWIYLGASSSFLGISGSNLLTEIPYQPGLPLADKEVFECKYVVEGLSPCNSVQETIVRISVVRQVDSGKSELTQICDNTIRTGSHDSDINLEDDQYLSGEDIEGIWLSESTGQIENEQDSNINIRQIYDDLVDGGNNLRYGCQNYNFEYFVESSSGVCASSITAVSFEFREDLRPFTQKGPTHQICGTDINDFNLFELLEFTKIGTTDFVYDNDFYVNWRLISGPSSLGLIPQPEIIEAFNPSINYHLGTINAFCETPGLYTFEYGVVQDINCPIPDQVCDPFDPFGAPNFTQSPCDPLFAQVTIEVLPFDYAGENTAGEEFCETEEVVDLFDLLNTKGGNTIVETGVWTNEAGDVVSNTFNFPPIDIDTDFNFTYTTTHATSGCVHSATLNFTVINEVIIGLAGESREVKVCSNNLNLNLFDQLGGTPDDIGIWTGPNGYVSATHIGEFFFNNRMIPVLQEGVYTYTIGDGLNCTLKSEATVTIQFVDPIDIGSNIKATFCKNQGSVDLLSLLVGTTPRTGNFTDTDATGALTGSVVDFATLSMGIYNFEYAVSDAAPCDVSTLNIELTILDEVQPGSAGEDNSVSVCSNNLTVNLFDQLGGTPVPTGTWRGPFNYRSNNHLGEFIDSDPSLNILSPGIYTYTVGGGVCSVPVDTATVTVRIVDPIEIGNDINITGCKSDASVNLFSLLDTETPRDGTFEEADLTGALKDDSTVDFSVLENGEIYTFRYTVMDVEPCSFSSLDIKIKIVELEKPKVAPQEYCILDGKRLNDIEVDVVNFNWYRSLQSDNPIIDNPRLLDGEVYYIATADAESCESERIEVPISILNIGETSKNGKLICPLDFQDGVSPDGNQQNDTFQLTKDGDFSKGKKFNLPEAFPNFDFEIYNRYGVVVYKANKDTPEFKGLSNVSLSVNDNLPSGVYFFVFNPNFKNNAPIQGSFYLSK